MTVKRSLTVGVIAEKLNLPLHRVEYLVKSRNIQPVERAGNLRVFSPDVLDILREINSARQPTAMAV